MGKHKFLAVLSGILCILSASLPVCAASTVDVKVPVSCEGQNLSGPFEVVLEDLYNDTKASISLKAGEGSSFIVTLPAEPGDYGCRVYQKKGDDAGASYDGTVYRADIHLYYESEKLRSQVTVYPEGEDVKAPSAAFYNKKEVTLVNTPNAPTSGSNAGTGQNLEQVETPRTPLESILLTARQTFDENPLEFFAWSFVVLCLLFVLIMSLRRKGSEKENEDEEE